MNADTHADRRKCIAHLMRALSNIENTGGNEELCASERPKISAYFMRYNPLETTFKRLPDFQQFFQMALRSNSISTKEADAIAHKAVLVAAKLRDEYRKSNGQLLKLLNSGVLSEFLDAANDVAALRALETRKNWFPDIFFEEFQWPCVIEEHIKVKSFKNLRLDADVLEDLARHSMRSLNAIVELIPVGLWFGISPKDIDAVLECFAAEPGLRQILNAALRSNVYAEVVSIPTFAFGFQGLMIGILKNLSEVQKENSMNILSQYAAVFAAQCAAVRKAGLNALIAREGLGAQSLARIVIDIASPVEHVIVCAGDECFGYIMRVEGNYLAGYETVIGEAADTKVKAAKFSPLKINIGEQSFVISMEPLKGYSVFDPTASWHRNKAMLLDFITPMQVLQASPSLELTETEPLEMRELEGAMTALEYQMSIPHGAGVAAKLFTFLELVKKKFDNGEMRLSNGEMQSGMARNLNGAKVTGYQVTGRALKKFEAELNSHLPARFALEAINPRVILVKWKRHGTKW